MSVTTKADEHVREACTALRAADEAVATLILELFARGCWGADAYSKKFEADVREASSKLGEIRALLGG